MKLTDASLRALPFAERQRDYADDALPGFCVRVGKKAKTFMLMVGKGANRKRYTIGRYPDLSLSKAREKAKDLIAANRLNPTEQHSTRFEAALNTFFDTHELKNRSSTAREHRRLFDRHWKPLYSKPLDKVSTGDVVGILDEMLGTPAEANAAFSVMSTFCNWALKRRLIDHSPIQGLDKPAAQAPRTRVLGDDELRIIWSASASCKGRFDALVRLLILTGQRRGQFEALRGEWIDRKNRIITWPPGAMKTGREHTLPYADMVAAALAPLPQVGLIFFPGRYAGGVYKKALADRCDIPHWTIHDLRRSFATHLAELGIAPHIIERILAHTSGTISGVAAIYNRHHFLPEMRDALQKWEIRLKAVLTNQEEAANGRRDL